MHGRRVVYLILGRHNDIYRIRNGTMTPSARRVPAGLGAVPAGRVKMTHGKTSWVVNMMRKRALRCV